jgi:hypothetical protein
MKRWALAGLVVLLAACVSTPVPSGLPRFTQSPSAAATAGDPHPDWPTTVVLALPPGVERGAYEDGLRYVNRQLAHGATLNGEHSYQLEAYEPPDMPRLVVDLASGLVNVAVLDAYWVATAQRSTDIEIRQLGVIDGRQELVGGWVELGAGRCEDEAIQAPPIATCNGASESAPGSGGRVVDQLTGSRILLGEQTSALEYLLPRHQLLAAGVSIPSSVIANSEERLASVCAGEYDVTVVPLPVLTLPSECAGMTPVVFATTPPVPTVAIVTAGLPDPMAEGVALDLAGQARCEIELEPSPCDPFWVSLWGRIVLSQAQKPDYSAVSEALRDPTS